MSLYDNNHLPVHLAASPELKFRAPDVLFERTAAFKRHVPEIVAFLRGLSAPRRELTLRTVAVDSSHMATPEGRCQSEDPEWWIWVP